MREDRMASRAPGARASASWGSNRIGPSTLVCMTVSKSSCVGASSAPARGPKTPALMTTTSKRSPSICQARPDTPAALATSSVSGLAPSSAMRARPASSRALATTAAPAARYWRTNSRPRPREAPMMRTFMGSVSFGQRQPDRQEAEKTGAAQVQAAADGRSRRQAPRQGGQRHQGQREQPALHDKPQAQEDEGGGLVRRIGIDELRQQGEVEQGHLGIERIRQEAPPHTARKGRRQGL
mmetsp:Transcript_34629/g.56817  ORF Transcript_34629/g.56817 Transcript_34629/m.56817 type:complete len:239 (-) Transcript_34629:4-720(-)